jgi:hypothetical protein
MILSFFRDDMEMMLNKIVPEVSIHDIFTILFSDSFDFVALFCLTVENKSVAAVLDTGHCKIFIT